MKKLTWIIIGASSIIAQEFAHLAAQQGDALILVGRNTDNLQILASDLSLRYKINCTILTCDLTHPQALLSCLSHEKEVALFIAASRIIDNADLTSERISDLISINILSLIQCIHAFWNKAQAQHALIFLSSVAACKGRGKNSLYGASKAALEIYLQGLQQEANATQTLTIARLGYIDTKQTYGKTPFAADPKDCAKACLKALQGKKRMIYYPFFWRYIMAILTHLPFALYRRIKQ